MPLVGNGSLLVEVQSHRFIDIFGFGQGSVSIPGYGLEPLSPVTQLLDTFDAGILADHWLLAKPASFATIAPDLHPWDTAHSAARANDYRHYVEPDIIHARPVPAAPASGTLEHGLNTHWPPKKINPRVGISPGWHLEKDHGNFLEAWKLAKGKGIRIAHLDTGYCEHDSMPLYLNKDLAYDYWDHHKGAKDPGTGLNPGHGTATLALLAGRSMKLTFGMSTYEGYVGGAPEAEIIPVRISSTVVHIATSSMTQGLLHALNPGDGRQCDVVTISHGGLPSPFWSGAVNRLYDAGIVIVAASGDSLVGPGGVAFPTHYTVYPSAYVRVITALGGTFDKTPFIAEAGIESLGLIQGCWGPDSIMEKAIAAFTPNVIWVDYKKPAGFDMNGNGTSSSTPQIAAACALWLQQYANDLPTKRDWRRVEACRLALFKGADHFPAEFSTLGNGLLNVSKFLGNHLAKEAIRVAGEGRPMPEDVASIALVPLLLGMGPPGSKQEEKMYESELAQILCQSTNVQLWEALTEATQTNVLSSPATVRDMVLAEPVSGALRTRIAHLNIPIP